MRLTWTVIVLAIALQGCSRPCGVRSGVAVTIGTSREEALRTLREAGAYETQIDMVPRGGGDPQIETTAYQLADGALLMVTYTPESSTGASAVSKLEICRDPEKPKAERTWTTLETLLP